MLLLSLCNKKVCFFLTKGVVSLEGARTFQKTMTEIRTNMNALQCDFGTWWVAFLPNSVVNNIDFDYAEYSTAEVSNNWFHDANGT